MHSHRPCRAPRTALALIASSVLAPAGVEAADSEMERLRRELESTRQELSTTQEELAATRGALADLARRVDSIQRESAAPPPPAPTGTARLAPVNIGNPAVSVVVDTAFSWDTESSYESIGWQDGVGLDLRGAELFVSAPIDPFLRGYVSVKAGSDEPFSLEEAALITTALPHNLTVTGGRFFADVGRLPHWHDETLPFVDRPPSIDRLIGGESQAQGVQVSWLAPLEHFVQLTGGVYDDIGAEGGEIFGRRSFDELTYLVRPHTYVDLTDTLNAELGGTWFVRPQPRTRHLWAVDLTVRHQPGTTGVYQGLDWGTEWLWNDQPFAERDEDGMVTDWTRHHRHGGYSYVEAFFARRYSAGVRFDYSQAPEGDSDLAKMISAFATWRPSEFQRLRLQLDNVWGDQATNQRLTLQWTAFLGSHRHGFAQR